MTIVIEEVDSGLARVEWTTEIHRAGHTDETFRLDRFHPSTSYVIVCYSSSLSIDDVDSKIGTRTHYTEICLMRILSATDADGINEESNNNETRNDFDYRHRSSVWASINGGDKTILQESSSCGTWKSEKFLVNFTRVRQPESNNWAVRVWKPVPLTCVLWIEFETFSRGEKNVLRRLTDFFVRQTQCDVQFSLENDQQQIGGHISILSAISPVFSAMFQHNMRESETGRVVIEDIPADIFKQLLHYIYSGRIGTPLSEVTAQPLYLAADKYDIGDLKDECIDFLLTCIRVDNALNLMAWAHIHSIDNLKEAILTFTAHHGQEICLLDDWEELTRNYPDLCVVVTRRIIEQMSITLNEREYSL